MIGIIGCGHVGGAMHELFPDAMVYDKYLNVGTKEDINRCDVAFVCVPTPSGQSGACDTSSVDEVLSWIEASVIVIRSTVPVGYTKRKATELNKKIVFQPEYYGETHNHPYADLTKRQWIVLGGTPEAVSAVVKEYQKVYTAELKIVKVDSDTAEMAKYMENAYLAMKVVFCNEIWDIAQAYGIDYDILREVWLMDPRVTRSHTFVYEGNRGYGGSCFPKDMLALRAIATEKDVDCSLISAAIEKNKVYHEK